MQRLLICTFAIIAVLSILSFASRLLGARTEPPAAIALLDSGDCPQPCWHGIRPGVTTIDEAKALLRIDKTVTRVEQTELQLCWQLPERLATEDGRSCLFRHAESRQVTSLGLSISSDAMQLGDAFLLFGSPRWIDGCQEQPLTILYFDRGTYIFLAPSLQTQSWRLRPEMTVLQIGYFDEGGFKQRGYLPRWQGFVTVPSCAAR